MERDLSRIFNFHSLSERWPASLRRNCCRRTALNGVECHCSSSRPPGHSPAPRPAGVGAAAQSKSADPTRWRHELNCKDKFSARFFFSRIPHISAIFSFTAFVCIFAALATPQRAISLHLLLRRPPNRRRQQLARRALFGI